MIKVLAYIFLALSLLAVLWCCFKVSSECSKWEEIERRNKNEK